VTWYDVTKAGFNFIDSQCTLYFDSLFKLNRSRQAFQSANSAFSSTSTAILAATNSTALTLAIVAQAFGLVGQLIDITSNTFLYRLPPAATVQLVQEMQRAYRVGAAAQSSNVSTPTDAYSLIQGYLSLCLPTTIEARIISQVSDARAAPVINVPGSEIQVVVGNVTNIEESVELSEAINRRTVQSSNERTEPLRGYRKTEFAINPFEETLKEGELRTAQLALCVVPDGRLGRATREAFAEFLGGAGMPRDVVKTGIYQSDWTLYKQAHSTVNKSQCKAPGAHKSARELGKTLN